MEVRFYEELNDFLPEERRKRDLPIEIDRPRCVKDAIESFGVPHTEVDLVIVDGRSVDFDHVLAGGERVAVYPMFEALDISPLVRLRPRPLRDPRFVADVPLEGLARGLRTAGFDTLWESHWDGDEIVRLALRERRTILTRNPGKPRRPEVERGYFVRAGESGAQVAEVIRALQLKASSLRAHEPNFPPSRAVSLPLNRVVGRGPRGRNGDSSGCAAASA